MQRAVEFYRFVGRVPVVERKEIPGFVGNRLQNALSREAIYLVEQGVVSPADLDTVITNSLGMRWATVGPFLGSHLGGGPGGYRHMAEHIGPGMKKMWAGLGQPSQDPESSRTADRSRRKRLRHHHVRRTRRARDRKQLAILSALDSEGWSTDDQLPADFYDFESLLPDDERKLLVRARDFMRTEVKPIVNEILGKRRPSRTN